MPGRHYGGQTVSIWMDTAELPRFEPLATSVEADVCVVGAGLTGLTAAYLLAQAGQRVIVLERGPVAAGNTRRTTAHLSNEIDDRYSEMIRIRGLHEARLAHDSHTAAIRLRCRRSSRAITSRSESRVRGESVEASARFMCVLNSNACASYIRERDSHGASLVRDAAPFAIRHD